MSMEFTSEAQTEGLVHSSAISGRWKAHDAGCEKALDDEEINETLTEGVGV